MPRPVRPSLTARVLPHIQRAVATVKTAVS
jgi:hypothetical protein